MFNRGVWVRPVEHQDVLALPIVEARRLAALAAQRFEDLSDLPVPKRRGWRQPVSRDLARVNAVTRIVADAGATHAQTLANTVFSFAQTLAFTARSDSAVTARDLESAVVIALGTPADDPLWSHHEAFLATSSAGAALKDPQGSTDPAACAALVDWGKHATAARRTMSEDLARLAGEYGPGEERDSL